MGFYSLGDGFIKIGRTKIRLTVSTNSGLPASQGYVYFRWGMFTYYLRFYDHRFYVYSFARVCKEVFNKVPGFCGSVNINKGSSITTTVVTGGGTTVITGGHTGNGGITWFKSSIGNWAFKFGKIAITFYSLGDGF